MLDLFTARNSARKGADRSFLSFVGKSSRFSVIRLDALMVMDAFYCSEQYFVFRYYRNLKF